MKTSVVFGDLRLPKRFWDKVTVAASGCWLWGGATIDGYGNMRIDGRTQLAHRVAYQTLVGPIVEPQIDHLCRTPRCVRPDHLEPVTQLENIRRRNRYRTHCKSGHEFTPENTYIRNSRGYRACRTCTNRNAAAYRARKAAL